MKQTILTGVKPTGIPHIGNFFGAIKPAIKLSNNDENNSFMFIANHHSLNFIKNAEQLSSLTNIIACTLLACGVNPEKTTFYRQSDVPEILELNWILSNYAPKSLLSRAHAYKAISTDNVEKGLDADSGINMGLFNYPILMSADILGVSSTLVPVGIDQKQHVEIAREIARIFNNTFGNVLTIPKEFIEPQSETIVGLDGRKMSKSYGNVIPLFQGEKVLKKAIFSIVTDSSLPTDPKSTNCTLFSIFSLFATTEEKAEMESCFARGIGWGEVKKKTLELALREIAPLKEKYDFFMQNPQVVENILIEGAKKARLEVSQLLRKVKIAIGIPV